MKKFQILQFLSVIKDLLRKFGGKTIFYKLAYLSLAAPTPSLIPSP
jgi:hypothetical protein